MTALGVSLLVLGAIVVVAEAHVPALGMLGGPGLIALAVGAVLAVGGLGGGLALGLVMAVVLVAVGATVLGVSVRKGIAVRRRRISAGPEQLIGHVGVVSRWEEPRGSVVVDGALWRAQRSYGDEEGDDLHAGDPVVVERRSGLTLAVRKAEEWELVR